MPHFAVHDANGDLVSWGTTVADDATLAENGLVAKEFTDGDAPPDGSAWNPATLTFDPPPTPEPEPDPAAVLEGDVDYETLTDTEKARTRAIVRALAAGRP